MGTTRVVKALSMVERGTKMQWEDLVRHHSTKSFMGYGKEFEFFSSAWLETAKEI